MKLYLEVKKLISDTENNNSSVTYYARFNKKLIKMVIDYILTREDYAHDQ